MLSVLIPIYQFDVRPFVQALHAQGEKLDVAFEIVCLDDASDESYRSLNRNLSALTHVKYEELSSNAGRSAIRNLLAERASYDFFLFVDCDGMPVQEDYLQRYAEMMKGDMVIYGGRKYQNTKPEDPTLLFHWTYGTQREAVDAAVRRKRPYERFMTNNFVVPRSIFAAVKMDESLSGYGHEDTLFAMEMEKKGVDVIHIENPLYHIGLEPASVFLEKQKNAILNLTHIIQHHPLAHRVKLYRFYKRLRASGMMRVLYPRLQRKEAEYIQDLMSTDPHMRSLDWLKLLWLHRAMCGC